MLMIRLQRVGRRNDPSFRLVLTDKRNSTKSGRFLEVLGHHDFRQGHESGNHIEAEKIKKYIANGAQVSVTAHNILVDYKVLTGNKKDALPSSKTGKESAEGAKKETPSPTDTSSVGAEVKPALEESPKNPAPAPVGA